MRFPSTRLSYARLAVALGVAGATAVTVLVAGWSLTAAFVEIGVFLAGVAGWAILGGKRSEEGAMAEDLRSDAGGVRLRQVGRRTVASRVRARRDVDIRQESRDA